MFFTKSIRHFWLFRAFGKGCVKISVKFREGEKAMNLETAIQEKVHTLPVEQQEEVLNFIETLPNKKTPLQRLGQIIDECFKDVPPEDFEKLPTDGAENHDHYLYGAPKK